MIIGVNALFLLPGHVGGTEIYTRSLLDALLRASGDDRFIVFTNRENHDSFATGGERLRRVLCPIRAASRPLRIAWEQLVLPFQVLGHRVDALFSPGFTTPLVCGVPSVVTVHDLIWRAHPENFPRVFRLFLRTIIPLSARRADRIIAVSQFTRDDLCRTYPVPQEKVRVIHEAPSAWLRGIAARAASPGEARSTLKALGVTSPYILTVSTLAPHKNLARLLAALPLVKKRWRESGESSELQLVLAGIRGRSHGEIARTARQLGLGEKDVRVTGWVEADRLAALYRSARLFVYPSLHEGFGLPLLEAMEFDVPVACSRATSLPEVGGDAVFYFDPEDVADMARVITRGLTAGEEARDKVALGRQRRMQFSWEKAARLTLDLLREAAARPPLPLR